MIFELVEVELKINYRKINRKFLFGNEEIYF